MLPVSALNEPPTSLLVREKSGKFIESLKLEMLQNRTCDVQPLLCMVKLRDGEAFDRNTKEGYKYDTLGGNNSREALQQLLAENPHLREQRIFTHRLCSVYSPMEASLALRLASKHNRASAFIHEMTNLDKVHWYKSTCIKC